MKRLRLPRKKCTFLFLLICLFFAPYLVIAQSQSMAYLDQTFPNLTKLYLTELNNCHTHYIFAVDVSGSMVKYDETVTPSLQAFVDALPMGEQVSVIPFGTDAKENTPGLCCKIKDQSQKQVLKTSLSTLYNNEGYSGDFRRNTDVGKALAAVNKSVLNNQQVEMNVIVVITDFLNDLPNQGEVKLSASLLKQLNKDFDNVTADKYTRVVAMQLPKAGSGVGYCLDQLQDEVFCNTSKIKKFDVVPVINDQNAISHWFQQLSRDIMTEKLRAVIQLDNERNMQTSLKTKVNINGKTTAEIHWKPNKLYTQLKLDSTYVDAASNYKFINNKEVWQTTKDTVLQEVELGKLKCKKWGFRLCKEPITIGLSLPTEYDGELSKLSIDKPVPDTSSDNKNWLFTFFLPFWLTVVLLILLLLYVISVIRAMVRNSGEKFIGTVDFSDSRGRDIGDTITVKTNPSKTLLIGGNGNCGCDLAGASWTIKVTKVKPSAFLFWRRPSFEWSAKSGFVRDGKNKKRGLLGRYGKNNTKSRINLECGKDSDQLSHNVTIKIK